MSQKIYDFIDKKPHTAAFLVLGIWFAIMYAYWGIIPNVASIKPSMQYIILLILGYLYSFFATHIFAKILGRSLLWAFLGFLGFLIVDAMGHKKEKIK